MEDEGEGFVGVGKTGRTELCSGRVAHELCETINRDGYRIAGVWVVGAFGAVVVELADCVRGNPTKREGRRKTSKKTKR